MNIETSPLTPDIVSCCQVPVAAVQLPDRHIAATIPSLCEPFQLNRWAQIRRIRDNKFLSRYLFLVPIVTKGGWQQMYVLVSWAIPTWLGTISLNKLTPEKQELVLNFQADIVDALHQHFSKKAAEPTIQHEAAPERTRTLPRSALEMHIEAWQELVREWDSRETRYEGRIVTLEREQAQMKAQLAALEQQRDGGARREEPPPQSCPILSQPHIGQVYALAHHHRRQSGEPISDMLRDLAETFGVPDMSDIPDEGWDYVLRWFWSRAQQ